MNSFGRIFRVTIFGESHGESVGIVVDGCPAGMPLSIQDFLPDLERRKGGTQKGTTPRQEEDLPIIKSGVFNNTTTGAPIAIFFENKNTRSGDYEKQRSVPRPGHADFVAHKKFGGYEDYRGSGHFSGRLTVALVAAGVIAKKILGAVKTSPLELRSHPSLRSDALQRRGEHESLSSPGGIRITSTILEIGGERDLDKGLQKAIDNKDSIGGIIECRAAELPVGLGEPFFDSVESVLSHAVFAIPAVRGIEFGTGFAAARMFGSDHNDPIENMQGRTRTNHAGGVVGGLTNGNELIFRIAIKPTSSTPKDQTTLNWETGNIENVSIKGRHDLCIALRVPVVLEAVTAIVLADLLALELHIPRIFSPGTGSTTALIYHVTTADEWNQARKNGYYEAESLKTEGFIHCSQDHQVAGVLERYFAGKAGLVKLVIDPGKLKNRLVLEWSESVKDNFPHVYGSINSDAVIDVIAL